MVWNLTKPEVKPKLKPLTSRDFQVGDRVRVLENTKPVWFDPALTAGTEFVVYQNLKHWIMVGDGKNNVFNFYDVTFADFYNVAKRTWDNLEIIG